MTDAFESEGIALAFAASSTAALVQFVGYDPFVAAFFTVAFYTVMRVLFGLAEMADAIVDVERGDDA